MNGLRVGLTGGIASGKTTAARRFAELGVTVIDADEIARQVVAPGAPALAEIVARFGPQMLAPGGELDRRALRARVFADPAERAALETILHPRIRAEMARRSEAATGPYAILVIPLLVEGGPRREVDRVLVIDVDESTQIARLCARDGAREPEARAILAAQASRAQRLAAADDVICNDSGIEALRAAVDALHRRYLELAAVYPGARSGSE
ncbi:MAG: dephospho-CoA kinase [Gammaproteobacteria bacterium]|nr:dephospho-CoA kinase [Gammaproteobacteria bacterium]